MRCANNREAFFVESMRTEEGWQELHRIASGTIRTRLDYYLGDRSLKEWEILPLGEWRKAAREGAAQQDVTEAQALIALIDVPVSEKETPPHPLVQAVAS
jgi:hypothetical protein